MKNLSPTSKSLSPILSLEAITFTNFLCSLSSTCVWKHIWDTSNMYTHIFKSSFLQIIVYYYTLSLYFFLTMSWRLYHVSVNNEHDNTDYYVQLLHVHHYSKHLTYIDSLISQQFYEQSTSTSLFTDEDLRQRELT